jgi:hypothetical protein
MKLNIINDESQRIENYTNVAVVNGELDLLNISDGECEEVILPACHLLSFSSLKSCVKKVAVGGNLKLQGLDLKMFCRNVADQRLQEEEASSLIELSKTVVPARNMCGIVSSLGFEIDTMNINGVQYQICAKRN